MGRSKLIRLHRRHAGGSIQPEKHFSYRSAWLRAAVLGANDGIVSTSSLILGVAAASASRRDVFIAGIAGLVAGSMSMAAGEYVSVASQLDSERSDIVRETKELKLNPSDELVELERIYVDRGLSEETAQIVAAELTRRDALTAHLRDELGIEKSRMARPLQATIVSAISFALGSLLPIVAASFEILTMQVRVVGSSLFALGLLGATGARFGGSPIPRAMTRVVLGGTAAMIITSLIGMLIGNVGL